MLHEMPHGCCLLAALAWKAGLDTRFGCRFKLRFVPGDLGIFAWRFSILGGGNDGSESGRTEVLQLMPNV